MCVCIGVCMRSALNTIPLAWSWSPQSSKAVRLRWTAACEAHCWVGAQNQRLVMQSFASFWVRVKIQNILFALGFKARQANKTSVTVQWPGVTVCLCAACLVTSRRRWWRTQRKRSCSTTTPRSTAQLHPGWVLWALHQRRTSNSHKNTYRAEY